MRSPKDTSFAHIQTLALAIRLRLAGHLSYRETVPNGKPRYPKAIRDKQVVVDNLATTLPADGETFDDYMHAAPDIALR